MIIPVPVGFAFRHYVVVLHLTESSAAEWVQVIVSILAIVFAWVVALPQLKFGLGSLKQMQKDTEQTKRFFEVQNRPYIGILPKLERIPVNREKDRVKFTIKNHGHLPAVVLSVEMTIYEPPPVEGETPAPKPVEHLKVQCSFVQLVVFPEIEREVKSDAFLKSELNKRLFTVNPSGNREQLFVLGFSVLYHTRTDVFYKYQTIRHMYQTDTEGKHPIILSEEYT